jgi:hypothetical protein
VAFGPEKVTDNRRIQERLNEFGHGGLVPELGGITFYGTEPGVIDYAMCQRGLADARWAIEKGDTGRARHRFANPFYQSGVMATVNERGKWLHW